MGFEEQYKRYSGATEAPTSNFDEMYKQASTGQPVSPEAVRTLQRKPAPLKENLAVRGLKHIANIPSNIARKITSPKGLPNRFAIKGLSMMLSRSLKKEGVDVSSKEVQADIVADFERVQNKIPALTIDPPEGLAEKIVDIGGNVGQFVAELAILRKIAPAGTSEAAIWEMQNTISGGTPGTGAAMAGVFSAPGKVIKGTGIGAKAGKLGLESAGLAGLTALETKIDTGEIDWKAVGVSAALPVALRTPGAIKKLIKAKHPKTLRAVVKASEESTIKRLKPDELKHYKVLKEGIKDDKVLNLLATKYPKLLELPNEIRFSSSISASGMFEHGTKTLILNPNYITSPQKAAKHLIHELVHAYQLKRGNFPKLWDEVLKTYGLQGKSTAFIQKKLRSLSPEEYKKLPTEQMSYRLEELIGQKIRSLVIKPVTIDQVSKKIISGIEEAERIGIPIRKAAVKKFHKKQVATAINIFEAEKPGGVFKALLKSAGGFKGKAKAPGFTPLGLSDDIMEIVGKQIEKVFPIPTEKFQRVKAARAVKKLNDGYFLTNSEIGLLSPVFGREAAKKIGLATVSKRPFSGWEIVPNAIQLFKLRFGLDIQTPRQGRSLAFVEPKAYLEGIGANVKGLLSNKAATKINNAVKSSPGYDEAVKVGYNFVGEFGTLSGRLEYYGKGLTERMLTSKYKPLRAYGRLFEAGERGAVAGINTMQKRLYDNAAKEASIRGLVGKSREKFLINRAKTHNTFMKLLKVPPGEEYKELRKLKKVADYLLFSSSMTFGRPLSLKALVLNKGSRLYAGSVIATNIGSIFAMGSIGAIIGKHMRNRNPSEAPMVDGSVNILDGMWGKLRIGDEVIDPSMGDGPFYRTLVRIGVSGYLAAKGTRTDEKLTTLAGKKVQSAEETIGAYLENRETALIGFAKTMATGKDWMGKPIPRLEATLRALGPEVIEAMFDAGMADGMWAALAIGATAEMAVGTATYPERAATTKAKFKDILARQNYQKKWDALSMHQQNKLRSTHRNQFEMLNEKIRAERTEKPQSDARIREEQFITNQRIINKMSPDISQWVEDIDLEISRKPKNWYLNDKNYNRYQNLIAQYVEERLSKIDFTGMEDKRRVQRVQVIVKAAKSRAFMTVRREINGR